MHGSLVSNAALLAAGLTTTIGSGNAQAAAVDLDLDASLTAADLLVLTADVANSDGSGFTGSLAGTLTDPFAYDIDNPTSPSPDQIYSSNGDGFHGVGAGGSIVNLAYTVSTGSITLSGTEPILIDLYGRDIALDRDNDFDINLFDGNSLVATAAGLAIPDDSDQHLRVTAADFGAPLTGVTFDGIRILARDSDGAGTPNWFTLMEIRVSAAPEPTSLALLVLGGIIALRRRRA